MELIDIIVIVLLLILVGVLFIQAAKNTKLSEENQKLKEIIEVKDKTIENLQASRVAVKDVIENFSMHEKVTALVEAGKSIEETARTLDIPVSKVELILKFDKIKKEHNTP